MKIDVFNHLFPRRFFDQYIDCPGTPRDIGKRVRTMPTIVDLNARFRVMDEFGEYVQLISLPMPPVEKLAGPDQSPDLARLANDDMAQLTIKYLDRFPGIKILTHHMGAMIPYFEGRVGWGWDALGSRTSDEDYTVILNRMEPHRPVDYFRKFYADTALFGGASATRCGLDFFGVDNVLFASDISFEPLPAVANAGSNGVVLTLNPSLEVARTRLEYDTGLMPWMRISGST